MRGHAARGMHVWWAGNAPSPLGTPTCAQDMTALPHLHEPGVLWNLASRYAARSIYTSVGAILIAVNPFQHVPGLFEPCVREAYVQVRCSVLLWLWCVAAAAKDNLQTPGPHQSGLHSVASLPKWLLMGCLRQCVTSAFPLSYAYQAAGLSGQGTSGLPPHVYGVACVAYRQMMRDGTGQAILVRGGGAVAYIFTGLPVRSLTLPGPSPFFTLCLGGWTANRRKDSKKAVCKIHIPHLLAALPSL